MEKFPFKIIDQHEFFPHNTLFAFNSMICEWMMVAGMLMC